VVGGRWGVRGYFSGKTEREKQNRGEERDEKCCGGRPTKLWRENYGSRGEKTSAFQKIKE
jgi:hypothetical protein